MDEREAQNDGAHPPLNLLFSELAQAAQKYAQGDLQSQRSAVADSISAITNFLIGQGFPTSIISPLHRPIVALVDRERGTPDPLFAERTGAAGRPMATIGKDERRGMLAAIAECSLIALDNGTNAQKFAAAAKMIRGGYFGGTVNGGQLKKARETVSELESSHISSVVRDDTVAHFRQFAEQLGEQEAFDRMVKILNRVHLLTEW